MTKEDEAVLERLEKLKALRSNRNIVRPHDHYPVRCREGNWRQNGRIDYAENRYICADPQR